jgi:hypothetical protein
MTPQEKALRVIEGLCLTSEKETAERTLALIYKYAHIAIKPSCQHPDWEKELNAMYELMNYNKVI